MNKKTIKILSVLPENLKTNNGILQKIDLAKSLFSILMKDLSDGRLEFRFTNIFIDQNSWKLITHVSHTANESWGELDVVSAVETGLTLLPLLADLGVKIGDYDTFFVYFDGTPYKAPRPSASVLYSENFRNLFGTRRQLGFITIPLLSYHASEGVYVHEYFHLLENLYSISPRHGFSPDHHYQDNKRQYFPDWKGSGQFPYYRYQFRTIIDPAGYDRVFHP